MEGEKSSLFPETYGSDNIWSYSNCSMDICSLWYKDFLYLKINYF